MAITNLNVLIYDDARVGGRPNVIGGIAEEVAIELGLSPQVCETVESALGRIVAGDTGAAVCSLDRAENRPGRRNDHGGRDPLGMMILERAADADYDIPVALLSGDPAAVAHVEAKPGNIVVSREPLEQIAPALQAWFRSLMAEPA